jgi:hypothetical protein
VKADKYTLALLAALGATGVEVFCVYDGLRDATAAQMAAGVGIAILAPIVPAYMEGARRYFAAIVFLFALVCVIVASGSRVGHGIDTAQQDREQATRAAKLAEDTERDTKATLADARTAAKTVCDRGPRTKSCADATKRVDDLLGKLDNARKTLATAPVVSGDGDVARVAAWTGGYLTEQQVRLYLPLLWPVTMALVGAFFWGVWGDGRPKSAPAMGEVAHETKGEKNDWSVVPPATSTTSSAPNVVKVLADIVQPADRRKRVEIEEVLRTYTEACKQRGADVATLEAFGAQAKAFADAAGIRVLASNGKVFWCGVKLAS